MQILGCLRGCRRRIIVADITDVTVVKESEEAKEVVEVADCERTLDKIRMS
jgi:hypothetical protein